MRVRVPLPAAVLLAIGLAWTIPADAVIKVDFPVSAIYGASKTVVVGTVAAINPANGVVTVKVTDTAKGDAYGETFRAQVVAPPELLKQVAEGQTVVLFQAKEKNGTIALIHLADTWLMAELIPSATPPAWRITGVHDAKQTYPGRTVALARLVGELKAGKPTLLNKADPDSLRAPPKELAKLKVAKPRFLVAADVNGDKKPDLLVGTAEGVRLFLAAASGYEDATEKWGLAGASGACAAFGDVNADGKADLLLGGTLWTSDGKKFTKAAVLAIPADAKPVAVALADVSGKRRIDAAILLASGQCLVFENPGAPDKPWTAQGPRTLWKEAAPPLFAAFGDWGDLGKPCVLTIRADGILRYALDPDGGAPANYERLTGEDLTTHFKAGADKLKEVVAAAIDVNGDNRTDLVLVAGGAPLLLVNRGFGCFFVDPDAGTGLVSGQKAKVPFKLSAATPVAAADMRGDGCQDVLVLTEDGTLYDVANPPAAK